MTDLIAELEAENRTILAHLQAIKSQKFVRAAAVKELAQAKALIVAHLGKEGEFLYQPLPWLADAKGGALQFQACMTAITTDTIAFFNKYDLQHDADLGLDFVRDLGMRIGRLKTRITQEEEKLSVLCRQMVA
ncbi:MAG: hypothetical protein H7338_19120 [Candidatus Sericytochromatia bacterium]|nr:hypothetical protein [Candidatus Sericytochromatia bacterium]